MEGIGISCFPFPRDPSAVLPQLQPCPRNTLPLLQGVQFPCCLEIPLPGRATGSSPESHGDAQECLCFQDLCSPLCWLHSQWKPPAPPGCRGVPAGVRVLLPWESGTAQTALEQPCLWEHPPPQ